MQNINQLIKRNFVVSNHSVVRLLERFEDDVAKYNATLLNWKTKDSVKEFFPFFKFIISDCSENRAINNNTAKMIPYYEKFGFDCEFVWMENPHYSMLLLFKKEKATKDKFTLITVLPTSYRVKYARNTIQIKEKKEDRKTKQLLHDYSKLKKQYGENVFEPINATVDTTHSTVEKTSLKEEKANQLIDLSSTDYQHYIDKGFLDPNSIEHKKFFQLTINYTINQEKESIYLAHKVGKKAKFWHLTLENKKCTIFARQNKKIGWLFYVVNDNEHMDLAKINKWQKVNCNFQNQ
jgi:hypothetical protein